MRIDIKCMNTKDLKKQGVFLSCSFGKTVRERLISCGPRISISNIMEDQPNILYFYTFINQIR